MNIAVTQMLNRYQCKNETDYVNALREIMQEIALQGLWRGKFFEHAAFYGGTAFAHSFTGWTAAVMIWTFHC